MWVYGLKKSENDIIFLIYSMFCLLEKSYGGVLLNICLYSCFSSLCETMLRRRSKTNRLLYWRPQPPTPLSSYRYRRNTTALRGTFPHGWIIPLTNNRAQWLQSYTQRHGYLWCQQLYGNQDKVSSVWPCMSWKRVSWFM